jgi:anti-sigma-K factor RskA
VNEQGPEHENVGSYVLDALSDEERAAFEAHLAGCAECRAEVAELLQVVDVLPLALDEIAPSESLRDRVMDISREPERPALVPIPGGRATRRPRPSWHWPELAAIAAAVLLVAGLGVWNIHLQQQINSDQAALAYQRQIAAAIAAHASVSPISGIGREQAASAALVQPRRRQPAYLVVQGLSETPKNHVYELWLFHGSRPEPSTVFSYSGSAPQIFKLAGAASGYSQAAVTVEPGPKGRTTPSGPIVLVGRLSA